MRGQNSVEEDGEQNPGILRPLVLSTGECCFPQARINTAPLGYGRGEVKENTQPVAKQEFSGPGRARAMPYNPFCSW